MSALQLDPRCRVILVAAAVLAAALLDKSRVDRLAALLATEIAFLGGLAFGGLAFGELLDGRAFRRALLLGAIPTFTLAPLAALRSGHALLPLPFGLAVSSEGLALALGLFLASNAALVAVAGLVATTPAAEIRSALVRLGVPASFVASGELAVREGARVGAELDRSRRAAEARGASARGRFAFLAARGRLGSLLSRSAERGARLDRALAARGFAGGFPPLPLPPVPRVEAVACAIAAAAILAFPFAP